MKYVESLGDCKFEYEGEPEEIVRFIDLMNENKGEVSQTVSINLQPDYNLKKQMMEALEKASTKAGIF